MSALISNNEIDMLYSRSTSISLAVHRNQSYSQEGIERFGLSNMSSSSESCYSSSSSFNDSSMNESRNTENEPITVEKINTKDQTAITNVVVSTSKVIISSSNNNNNDDDNDNNDNNNDNSENNHNHRDDADEIDSGGVANGIGLGGNSSGGIGGKRRSFVNGNCSTRSADDNPTTTTTTTTTNGVVANLNQPSFNELSITCDTLSETDDEDFKDILMEEDDDDFEQVTEVFVDRDDAIDDDDNNSYVRFESNHSSFLTAKNQFNNNNNNNNNNSVQNTRQNRSSSSPNNEFLQSLSHQQQHQLQLLHELYQQSSRRYREQASSGSNRHIDTSFTTNTSMATPSIPINTQQNNNQTHNHSKTTGSPFLTAIPSTSHRSPSSFLNSPTHSPSRPFSPASSTNSSDYCNSPRINSPPLAIPLQSSSASNTMSRSEHSQLPQQHLQSTSPSSNNNSNSNNINHTIYSNSPTTNNNTPLSTSSSSNHQSNIASQQQQQNQQQHYHHQYSSSPPPANTPSTPSSPSLGSVSGNGSYSPLSKSSSINNKPNMLSTILKKSKKRLTTTFANRDLSDFDETPSYVQIYRGMTGESWRAKVYSTTTVRDLISMLLSTTTIDPSTLTLYISRSLTDSSLGSNSSTSANTTLDSNKPFERQLHEDEKILKAQRKWSGPSVFILKTTNSKGNSRYSVSSINSETSDQLHHQHQYNHHLHQHQYQQSVDISPLSSLSSPLITSTISPSMLTISPSSVTQSSVDINIPYMSLNDGIISDMDSTSTNSSSKSPYYYQQSKKENWKIGEYPKEGIRWISPSDLVINTKIGEGSFSRVYKGGYMGKTVAIKVLNDSTPEQWENFKKEYRILSMTSHPRLIRLYGASKESKLLMVMEYCGNGSLIKMMTKKNFYFSWELVLKWIKEAVEGINFLHTMKPALVHRDIKPHNLLITSQYELKVADLGLTKEIDVHTSTLRGTLDYMAPELFDEVAPSPSSDVYSLGIVMWELINRFLTGKYKRPFEDIPQISFSYQIPIFTKQGIRPTMPPNIPHQLEDIILRCWHQDPDKRPTCHQLVA
ncbi:protein kinase [Heterostelium album PN500]|uniref:Protein kinase n=1 Tax=Heterostelium pallidum (strain ATCC 26659 / Pp 5 / PN500) TaxID=670386 RepID=D3BNH8_HETP5|nr:protein kinase [Heterostelium album PN500]EFA76929.1 protein kinase [Heterostelium album PN500]|eukprot:XP_020429061.1 protein kinase [Heterostelium album PN500]